VLRDFVAQCTSQVTVLEADYLIAKSEVTGLCCLVYYLVVL